MAIQKKIILFLIIPLCAFHAHKYYLSLTQLNYNKENKSIELILKVFMDDIEFAVNKKHNVDLQLNTKKELKNTDTYFKKYLESNFILTVNDSIKKHNYIGKEYNGNTVYFYLEIEHIKAIKTIEIESKILTQYFEDQQNLIKAKVNGKHKSLLLTKKNDKGLLNF